MSTPRALSHRLKDHAYRDFFEQLVIEAAFAWQRRTTALDAPHYTSVDLAEMERRLAALLKGLTSSIELGWACCEAALAEQGAGEQFTATVIAFNTGDSERIKIAVEAGLSDPRATKGLISALGWLPDPIARPWIARLLQGKDMNHKYLGVAACGLRRENPGEQLNDILAREECRAHVKLHARALRLVGELRRDDLSPIVEAAMGDTDSTIAFWSTWSSILLGHHAAVKHLRPFVFKPGPYRARALQMALRILPLEEGRAWISALAQDPANIRVAIAASGVLGDPRAANWLIEKMTDPRLARLAGEAFANITGIDLDGCNLTLAPEQRLAPLDTPDGDDIGFHEDQNLPWPDAGKVAALWRNRGPNFKVGQRYFLGKVMTPDRLKLTIADGTMRQRHAAALALALIDRRSRFINTRARSIA